MIDGDKLIGKQLAIKEITDITFSDGRSTRLTPAKFVPPLADDNKRISLNGAWRVRKWPFDSDESILVGNKRSDAAWEEINQPGKVFYYDPEEDPAHLQGWDRVTLAHIDENDGALIRRRTIIPRAWKGKRIYLRFDSIYPSGRVYCNGILLGEHLSGLTPVEWDVSDLVQAGEKALVAVRLLRRHKHVQMDMPRHALEFTGLAQDAYFHATEPCQISDFYLVSSVDDAYRNGKIEGQVWLKNHAGERTACKLAVSVSDQENRVIADTSCGQTVNAGETKCVCVRLDIENISLWNDEFPVLYPVLLRLETDGQNAQRIRFRTGFRRLELKNQLPLLNGRLVKFRGVNHLTFHPEFGMYTPGDWLRRCLTLMKRANVNAIRTHFLGPPALSDLCDEMGIYLLQELPVDWGTHYIHDPEWVGPALMRIESGIRRDRHHPSVMVWSIGNENMPWDMKGCEDGWNHLRIYHKFAKTLDPSRPTMFPPPGPANKVDGIFEVRVGDIADVHYSFKPVKKMHKTGKVTNPKTWQGDMETTTREEALKRGWSGVWFSSEYGIFNYQPDLLNAPYLSQIADFPEDVLSGKNTQQVFMDRLRREWGFMRDDPTCLGGAYFPWLCAGAGNNPWGWVRWGEDADWGTVTADLLPKPAFWAMRVLFSPVQFPPGIEWKEGQTELEFEVANGFNSIDLSQCTLRTMMGGGGKWMGQMRAWQDVPVCCPPGEKTFVRVPIWNEKALQALRDGLPVVCRCILLDPSGFRTITADIKVVPPEIDMKNRAMPIGPDAVLE